MNKFTIYTNEENYDSDFVNLCLSRLVSNKSEVIVLRDGLDFNLNDIEVDSLPALKFSFSSNGVIEYEKTFRNLEESISYLKSLYLIP